MNVEALESKVAQLLNKSEEEKSEIFSIFKEKIANFLNVGEALKIDGLGVFQLKEQLAHSDTEKLLHSAEKVKTLVYSPESEEVSGDSLFMNLELAKKLKDDSEFDENVFQLGIGKPVATVSDKNILDGDQTGNMTEAVEKNINLLLNDSEKLQDFDLWEDYLKNKETKSVIEDEQELGDTIDDIVDSVEDEEFTIENKKSLLDDFEPLGEEELLDNYIEDNDFINDDDVKKIVDEIDKDETEFEVPSDELITDELDVEFDEPSIDTQNILDELNDDSDVIEEKINDKITDELDEISLENKIDEEAPEDKIDEVVEEEIVGELRKEKDSIESTIEEIDEPKTAELIEDDIVKEKIPAFKEKREVKYVHSRKRRSSGIYLLIAAFTLIGVIGIYYLFFDNPTWLYDQHEVEIQLSQQHTKELEEARLKAHEGLNGETDETNNVDVSKTDSEKLIENTILSDKIESSQETIVKKPDESKEITNTPIKNNSSKPEEEVAENIYFDGNVYHVQVSSWKQEKFAKIEVAKLQKKGLDAFFVKVFIPKFNSNWHRVRIGPYSTINEAKENQKKLKK